MSSIGPSAAWWGRELRRLRLSVSLLLERRTLAVIAVDLLILLQGLIVALTNNGEPSSIYGVVVLVPCTLLGVPILANAIALERKAGTLNLLLAAPTTQACLLRRYGSFCALLAFQGWVAMVLAWFIPSRPFPLLLVLIQILLVCALVGAVSMFWGVHLKSTGAVILASAATLAALGPWFLNNPMPTDVPGHWVLPPRELLDWLENNAVLAAAAIVFYLYARRRIARCEPLLS
jgi:hypothetical protein